MDIFGIGQSVAGTLSAGASIYGSLLSAKNARELQQRQIDWERERATHSHQWEVEDLKNAGLNPILSAGGNGATTGGISAPMPDTTGISNAGTAFADVILSMTNSAKTRAEIGKTGAETNNITADTLNKQATAKLITQQAINEQLKAGLISANTAQVELKNLQQKFENDHREATYWNNFVNTASSSAKNISDAGTAILDKILPKKTLEKAGKKLNLNKIY